jgi:hypothetical protein
MNADLGESEMSSIEFCARCGARVRGGTQGCWDLFNGLLALEYSDSEYAAVHLLSVDAHALQHSEDHGIKNKCYHLVDLSWLLEQNGDPRVGSTPAWLQKAFDGMPQLPTLTPPPAGKRGAVTVADVICAATPQEHRERVYRWARSVWDAWSEHHAWARGYLVRIQNS